MPVGMIVDVSHVEHSNKTARPIAITLQVNENGTALVVKSASFDHNHEVSQVQD